MSNTQRAWPPWTIEPGTGRKLVGSHSGEWISSEDVFIKGWESVRKWENMRWVDYMLLKELYPLYDDFSLGVRKACENVLSTLKVGEIQEREEKSAPL